MAVVGKISPTHQPRQFSFLRQEIEFGSQARNEAADEAGLSKEKE